MVASRDALARPAGNFYSEVTVMAQNNMNRPTMRISYNEIGSAHV